MFPTDPTTPTAHAAGAASAGDMPNPTRPPIGGEEFIMETTTKLSADARRAIASAAFTAALSDSDAVVAAVAAFTTVPNARAYAGACGAAAIDATDDDDDAAHLAITRLVRVIRAALPESGPTTSAADPAATAAASAGALTTYAAALRAAADAADANAASLSDAPAADAPLSARMARVIETANAIASGTPTTASTPARRRSEPADYIDGATFTHGDHTLVIDGDTWLVNGEPIDRPTPSGAVIATGSANQSGYVYWTVVR
jgi:hypothetical protein